MGFYCCSNLLPSFFLGLPGPECVQAGRKILVKQNAQVGSLCLDLPLVDPAADWRVPSQVCRVDVQDPWGAQGILFNEFSMDVSIFFILEGYFICLENIQKSGLKKNRDLAKV